MKPCYRATSEPSAVAASESHATATATTTLGKAGLRRQAECDTYGDCDEKNF
jgi:hypothetical protein